MSYAELSADLLLNAQPLERGLVKADADMRAFVNKDYAARLNLNLSGVTEGVRETNKLLGSISTATAKIEMQIAGDVKVIASMEAAAKSVAKVGEDAAMSAQQSAKLTDQVEGLQSSLKKLGLEHEIINIDWSSIEQARLEVNRFKRDYADTAATTRRDKLIADEALKTEQADLARIDALLKDSAKAQADFNRVQAQSAKLIDEATAAQLKANVATEKGAIAAREEAKAHMDATSAVGGLAALQAAQVVVGGIVGAFKEGEQYSKTLKTNLVDLTAVLDGDGTAAKRAQGQMQSLARDTGLAFREVLAPAQVLFANKVANGDTLVRDLRAIADMATVLRPNNVAGSMDEIAKALQKMHDETAVSMRDINRLRSQGVPALQFLADAWHESTDQMTKDIKAGLIPASQAIPALLGEAERHWAGVAEKAANTGDALDKKLAQVRANLESQAFGPLITDFQNIETELVKWSESTDAERWANRTAGAIHSVIDPTHDLIKSLGDLKGAFTTAFSVDLGNSLVAQWIKQFPVVLKSELSLLNPGTYVGYAAGAIKGAAGALQSGNLGAPPALWNPLGYGQKPGGIDVSAIANAGAGSGTETISPPPFDFKAYKLPPTKHLTDTQIDIGTFAAQADATSKIQYSCALFASQLYDSISDELNKPSVAVTKGAKSLVDEFRAQGAKQVPIWATKPGDLIEYHGARFGNPDARGDGGGYHVAMAEGGGMMWSSNHGKASEQKIGPEMGVMPTAWRMPTLDQIDATAKHAASAAKAEEAAQKRQAAALNKIQQEWERNHNRQQVEIAKGAEAVYRAAQKAAKPFQNIEKSIQKSIDATTRHNARLNEQRAILQEQIGDQIKLANYEKDLIAKGVNPDEINTRVQVAGERQRDIRNYTPKYGLKEATDFANQLAQGRLQHDALQKQNEADKKLHQDTLRDAQEFQRQLNQINTEAAQAQIQLDSLHGGGRKNDNVGDALTTRLNGLIDGHNYTPAQVDMLRAAAKNAADLTTQVKTYNDAGKALDKELDQAIAADKKRHDELARLGGELTDSLNRGWKKDSDKQNQLIADLDTQAVEWANGQTELNQRFKDTLDEATGKSSRQEYGWDKAGFTQIQQTELKAAQVVREASDATIAIARDTQDSITGIFNNALDNGLQNGTRGLFRDIENGFSGMVERMAIQAADAKLMQTLFGISTPQGQEAQSQWNGLGGVLGGLFHHQGNGPGIGGIIPIADASGGFDPLGGSGSDGGAGGMGMYGADSRAGVHYHGDIHVVTHVNGSNHSKQNIEDAVHSGVQKAMGGNQAVSSQRTNARKFRNGIGVQ